MMGGRQQLQRIYFFLINALGAEGRMLRDIRRNQHLIVLNLHHVQPEPNPYWSPLHPRLFEELLQFVAPRFRVTTFDQLSKNSDPRPPLVLSFDDGYYDYIEYAVPLLHKYGLPSNQNVVTDCVLTGQPPAIVRLCDFLNQAPDALIDEICLPGFPLTLRNRSTEAKTRYGTALCRFMKMRPCSEAAPLWDMLDRVMSKLDFCPSRMMSVSDIGEIASGHEVGAHSSSHQSMELENDSFFEQDLDRCLILFRDQLKLPLRVYAFPNGSWRPELVRILERRGVEHILLVGDAYASIGEHVYPRFNYYAESRHMARVCALGFKRQRSVLCTTLSILAYRPTKQTRQ